MKYIVLRLRLQFSWLLVLLGGYTCCTQAQDILLPVHSGQALTILSDGNILATGGLVEGISTNTAFLVDSAGKAKPLPSRLLVARSGHSATALPDGNVLIFGGTDGAGHYVRQMEIFSPQTMQFTEWSGVPLTPRAFHTATLLTDGKVLIVGGTGEGGTFPRDIQLWDFRTGSVRSQDTSPIFARQGHSSSLLADGRVLISGGESPQGAPVNQYELYYPTGHIFQSVGPKSPEVEEPRQLTLTATAPTDGATDYPITEMLKLRFSTLVDLKSANTQTIKLTANGSAVSTAASVASAERGRLAFLIPSSPLLPGTVYSLSVSGVQDQSGNQMPPTTIQFLTMGDVDDGSDDGWTPDATALHGNWNSRTGQSKWQDLPALKAKAGMTALAGQVLGLSGRPLAHTTLQIDNNKVETDDTGRFLLTNLASGHQMLIIDGQTANKKLAEYGQYEVGVDLLRGVTTTLNYTIWMTKLDKAHAVTIPSPTTAQDTVITSPSIPGLELHLPKGTTIVGRDGKAIRELTVTPIPLDKPPFPLPTGLRVPIYFTVQPGLSEIRVPGSGANVPGAQLYYPNSFGEPAGTIYNFWNYDAASKGWYIYGNGYVDSRRTQIIPDPGVYVYELTGAMVGDPTAENVRKGGGPSDGDPVSLASGQFVHSETDLTLTDTIPIQLTRTYTTNDHYQRPFGIGTTDNYDIFMVGNVNPYTYQELVLPDGSSIRFNRTSSGTGYLGAVYLSSSSSGPWYGATISQNQSPNIPVPSSFWVLQTRDGSKYGFPEAFGANTQTAQALLGFQDRNGNVVTFTRDQYNNLTKITSPMGRTISLGYDALNRIITATDNTGRTVSYTYDSGGRLATTTDVNSGITTYAYNASDQVTSITDARGIKYLINVYDSFGRITQQTQADGSVYAFQWTPSNNSSQLWTQSTAPVNRTDPTTFEGYTGLISQVSVTDPRGYVRQVVFDNLGRTVSDTRAVGQAEQQSSSTQYYSDNLVQSMTDALGRTTALTYDALGNPTSVTRLSGTSSATTTTALYDQTYSNVLSVTDPLNHTTTLTYDSNGNLLTTSDPLGHGLTVQHQSPGGLVTSLMDPVGNITRFSYIHNDLTGITDPLGNQTQVLPDAAGRTVSVVDPLGNATLYQYDNKDSTVQVQNPQGHTVAYAYDANENLLSVQDYNQHVTHYTYDGMDRPVTRTDPLNRASTTTYDLGGFPVSVVDRKGQATSRTFDGLGRDVFVGYGTVVNGGSTTYQSSTSLQYDAGNRMTKAADTVSGTISRTYDSLDHLMGETNPQGSISYTYDAADRRTTAQVASGTSISYTYDNANRLNGITQGLSQVGFSYDAANRRSSLSLPNGVTLQYGYDSDSRLKNIAYTLAGNSLGTLSYTFDAAGREVETDGTFARTNLPLALGAAVYDAGDQLSSWDGLKPTYDANGDTTTDISGNGYVWDSRSQLATITGSSNASFVYDASGRRTSKSISGTPTSFLYDGVNRISETLSTGSVSYLTGGTDESFLRTDSSGSSVPLVDQLGSNIETTDMNANVLASFWYSPFGNTTITGSQTGWSAQYTGRENDGTGLYFYRNRYYNPQTGRFVSQDPTGFDGGMNLYAYVADDPISFVDPFGLDKNAGGKSDGDSGNGFPNSALLKAVCNSLPNGRTLGVSAGLGGFGSVGGGGELVINYDTGQVSAFGFGGVQIGWNGGVSGSVYAGAIYGLNGTNSNYSGGFTGFNGGAGLGIFGAKSSGGLTNGVSGLKPSGSPSAYGMSFGGGLLSGFSGGLSATDYTKPTQLGKWWAFSPQDLIQALSRKLLSCSTR